MPALPGSHGGLSTLLSEQLPTTSVHREMTADVEPPANGAAKSNANMAHGGAGVADGGRTARGNANVAHGGTVG